MNSKTVKMIVGLVVLVAVFVAVLVLYKQQITTPAENTSTNSGQTGNTTQQAFLGSTTTLAMSKEVTFNDGLKITLKEINDSRCKPGVVCIWAGELSPVFSVSGGGVHSPQEVRLGTVNNKKVTQNGYIFELKDATTATATITVTKAAGTSQTVGACYVGGCSSEICSDQKDVVSACFYDMRHACYKTATCARQANGQCGWTPTPELIKCVANVKE